MTAEEIRERIISVTLENGGHLASSLGAVEIAMALREVFDPFKDRVLWDVGHQAYAWKILTGRNDRFDTLRKAGGISPFPNPAESKADAAVSGHAGSALSVALGMAAARDLKGTDENIVAVVGDSSMANGHSFEALNNCAASTRKVIVVLNDNDMAISRPVGSFAKLLGRLITGVRYNRVKSAAEAVGHKLKLTFLRGLYHKLESRVKSLFLVNAYFEQFGLRYIGPVDGHDVEALKDAFMVAKDDKRSVIVHVVTKKGKGYQPAEKDPTAFHGIGPRNASSQGKGWSEAFGDAISALARKDPRIVVLTAAMKDGTGLNDFAREFPGRIFDVGIAEGHMVAFAAGLAANGMRPVVAVYSTFLQRAMDQLVHDVAISSLPVVLAVDRAGVVGADGVTHQGVFDISMARTIPNLKIAQPCDEKELTKLLEDAIMRSGPTIIRYPRGKVGETIDLGEGELSVQVRNASAKRQIWVTGDRLMTALKVAEKTGDGVVYARYLKPFDEKRLKEQRAEGKEIVSIENGAVVGGFGEAIGADIKFGWPDEFIAHGTVAELEKQHGLDVESIVRRLTPAI